jgi:hypothetical protein
MTGYLQQLVLYTQIEEDPVRTAINGDNGCFPSFPEIPVELEFIVGRMTN